MSRLAHDQKSRLPLLLSLLGAVGCDIVQGFQDAGNALFPEQSTHLAAPGVRIASGNFRELGLVAGSELYLLARAADDDGTAKLYSMRYADPRPCELEGVRQLAVTNDRSRSAPLFSYFSEDTRRGTLRFADARCNTYELTLQDATLPVGETSKGVVVWAGDELWLAIPETGQRELIAEEVRQVTRGAFGQRIAVRAGGKLLMFGPDWELQGRFGEDVRSVLRANDALFYLDAIGAHRVSATGDGARLESTLVAEGGCSLGTQDGRWVTLRAPCGTEEAPEEGPVLAVLASTGQTFTLPFDADPTQLRLMPARGSSGRDPLSDPFWFFYLRSGATEESRDTLYVRTPAGAEHALGARSTLSQLRLLEGRDASGEDAHGYALIDVEGEAGRYIWWNAAGETKVLAERALWRPVRLFIDSDGTIGNLAIASGKSLQVLAERVPWQYFEYWDDTASWTVLFHDVEEDGHGRLSVVPTTLDALQSAANAHPIELPELAQVADRAIVAGTTALHQVLSGVSYLQDFDFTKRTGTLAYRNLELRFTATINTGVSDYFVASDELLYAVPYGKNAGIWLVDAK